MAKFQSIIASLHHLAQELLQGKMDLRSVPYDSIINLIEQIYAKDMDLANPSTIAYCGIITEALKHGNAAEIGHLLNILACHLEQSDRIGDRFTNQTIAQETAFSRFLNERNQWKLEKWYRDGRTGAFDTKPFEGKGVIYTAVIGGYDEITEPRVLDDRFDYVLFTDDASIQSDVWDVRVVERTDGLDNTRKARQIKIMGHELLSEYDYSIWIDGKIQIKGDVREYIEKYRKKESLLCFCHHTNANLQEELVACSKLGKDDAALMSAQVEAYWAEGYPREDGMLDTAVLVRDYRDPAMINVMNSWWQEILAKSKRDQLSIGYSCWKNDYVYDTSPLFVYENPYFTVNPHRE